MATAGALGALAGTAAAEPSRELARAPLSPEALPYSPQSAFRTPIPKNARTDPRSGPIIGRLVQNLRDGKAIIASSGDVPTVYRVKPSDPFLGVNVGGREVRFRVPSHAEEGRGSDNPLVLLDRNHPDLGPYVELRLWRAGIDRGSGRISAGGAGLFRYDAEGTGRPFLGFGTGSGLSILSGLVRPREVANGRIDHAIRFAYSNTDFIRGFRPPAIKSDQPRSGYSRDPGSGMEMGMRLQLDPRVRCERRTAAGRDPNGPESRFLRALCVALQRYGMIVMDGTGQGGVMIQLENERTAPWSRLIGQTHNGSYGYIIRDQFTPRDGLERDSTSGIPWNRMRVIAR